MPIYSENFVANSLSGTVLVTNGFANISLPTNPFALEGNKNFVIKIRKGGINGLVIATSPTITIRDTSQFVSLTANVATVAEGNLISLTLVTANATNNSNVFYSILPVTANVNTADFVGANVGKATIIDNQATFSFFANADYSLINETGETFKVQLRENSPIGNIIYTTSNVVITDFYKTYNIISLIESSSSAPEDVSITFTFTGHNIPPGTLLYYDTVGSATSFQANTGSFAMNGVSNTISITATNIPAGQTLDYSLRIRKDSLSGEILRTSNLITVLDAAATYTTVSSVSGNVFVSNGYTTHVFTTANTITFSGVSGVPERNRIEYMVVAGGGAGAVSAGGGAGGMITGEFNLTSANLGTYTVVVGGGGQGAPLAGGSGSPSYIQNSGNTIHLSTMGGGGGAQYNWTSVPGGSGGGGGTSLASSIPGQGNPGTNGPFPGPGVAYGGGGAGSSGAPAPTASGGTGRIANIAASIPTLYGQANTLGRYFAGGGGGFGQLAGGVGGLGGGGLGSTTPSTGGYAGNAFTGGGGGGGVDNSPPVRLGGAGGSGIVILRYMSSANYIRIVESSNLISQLQPANVTFNITSTGANGLSLYYTTSGNVTINDINQGNTGSFIVTGDLHPLTLQANVIPANTTKYFNLEIRTGSVTGPIVLTSNVINIVAPGPYISATGGNVTVSGGYKIHTFTTSNNFVVNAVGSNNTMEILLVAGGGGGAPASDSNNGGAGAGGLLYTNAYTILEANTFPIVVGAGGAATAKGANTTGFGVVADGGGRAGGGLRGAQSAGGNGGSSGGGSGFDQSTPAGTKTQGNIGVFLGYGNNGGTAAGGGGGAGQTGTPNAGKGGDGRYYTISGSNVAYAGGGGGGPAGGGGAGGGAPGSQPGNPPALGLSGNVNTGGGAGGVYQNGGGFTVVGGSGGSGVVIIRYPFA